MRELAIQFNSVTTSLPNIRVLQVIQIEAKLLFSKLLFHSWTSFFFCSQLNEFLKKLGNECHWLHLMSERLCARCTVCIGKKTEPCARYEKSSCWHHDCGHYIPLDGRLLCCEPGHMLEKEPLIPWIRAIEHVSKVRYVLSTNSTIATAM